MQNCEVQRAVVYWSSSTKRDAGWGERWSSCLRRDRKRGLTKTLLKLPALRIKFPLRLVDTIVLEGMGLPTAGFDSRSESPTDPTA